jgi:hypothetical protein
MGRGTQERQQTSLRSPHPRCFLAMACTVAEDFEKEDKAASEYGPRIWARLDPAFGDETNENWTFRYFVNNAKRMLDGFDLIARSELKLPLDVLSAENEERIVALYACQLHDKQRQQQEIKHLRATNRELQPLLWVTNAQRMRSSEIVFGAYYSLPLERRNRQLVADMLIRGLPRGEIGVDEGHVRNALDTIAKRHSKFDFDNTGVFRQGYAFILVAQYQVLDFIWAKAEAHLKPRHVTPETLKQLMAQGLHFKWRDEVESQGDFVIPTKVDAREMLKREIARLKKMQHRKFG